MNRRNTAILLLTLTSSVSMFAEIESSCTRSRDGFRTSRFEA